MRRCAVQCIARCCAVHCDDMTRLIIEGCESCAKLVLTLVHWAVCNWRSREMATLSLYSLLLEFRVL